jgi:hypothetical protein
MHKTKIDHQTIDDLILAMKSLLSMDIKGHSLEFRLQFTDTGRKILSQCNDAINRATED